MSVIELSIYAGVFIASFGLGYINAALGDPLDLAKLGFLPRT